MNVSGEPEIMVWLNGVTLPEREALAPVLTPGWLQGVGIFETVSVRSGRTFALSRHLKRLAQAAERLRLALPTEDVLRGAVETVILQNRLRDALVRITVSAAAAAGQELFLNEFANQVLVHSRPVPTPALSDRLITVPWRRNEFGVLSGLKTTSCAENTMALEWVRLRGAREALFLNTGGDVCEGATTNIFLVRDERVITPSLSSGCLPGVTRGLVLEMCRRLEIPCLERAVSPGEILSAEEIFITSCSRGVRPVEAVDDFFPPRNPGIVSSTLRSTLEALRMTEPDP